MKKIQQKKVHRGQLLKKIVDESHLSITDLVLRMNYSSRNTFYNHQNNPDLSLAILKRYGRVLNYDFSNDVEGMEDFKYEEENTAYLKAPGTIEEATSQRDFYHRLYMELLEDVRSLKAEIASLKQGTTNSTSKKT